jgi:hypothetical protein
MFSSRDSAGISINGVDRDVNSNITGNGIRTSSRSANVMSMALVVAATVVLGIEVLKKSP